MAKVKNNRTGFPSLYRATYEEGWHLKNLGYDYTKDLLNAVEAFPKSLKKFQDI